MDFLNFVPAPDGDELIIICEDTGIVNRLPLQPSKLLPHPLTRKPVVPPPPRGTVHTGYGLCVNFCDIFMQYYATHNCTYGEAFCRIFLHQLVNAPVKVVRMLPDVLCSSRDGVPLGPKTDTFRQTSLSKWIDWYQFRPPLLRH